MWLSDLAVSVGGIIKKVGTANKTCESPSDHIFDFTRSGYKIIPNMWSELAEVNPFERQVVPSVIDKDLANEEP